MRKVRTPSAWLLIAPCISGLLVPGPSAAVHAQVHRDSAGVRITVDSAQPDRRIETREVVRIGSLDAEGPSAFGDVEDLAVDMQHGELYVLDGSYQTVKVFTMDGTFLRTFGREGEGPGEFTDLSGVAVARDTVVVAEGTRFHVFTRLGEHLKSGLLRTERGVTAAVDVVARSQGWTVLMREVDPDVPAPGGVWREYGFTPEAGLANEWLYQRPLVDLGDNLVLQHYPMSGNHADGFVDAPTPGYEIRRFNASGQLTRIHRFDSKRIGVDARLIEIFRSASLARCEQTSLPPQCFAMVRDAQERIEFSTGDVVPVIADVVGSRAGRILVKRRDLDPTPMPIPNGDDRAYDLIAESGEWIGQVELPAGFVVRWLNEEVIWGVDFDQLDVPYVVAIAYNGDLGR